LNGTTQLTLAEVKVFGSSAITTLPQTSSINYAQGHVATQSSTAYDGQANRAVDGNTNGDYTNNSISHTDFQANPWWQVDLSESRLIDKVEVWNRTDGSTERSNFYLIASDMPFVSDDLMTVLSQPGVSSYYFSGQVNEKAEIPFVRSARYVRIQLNGTTQLTLAEVKVFGH
jgi:hypothetical protein